MAHTPVLLKEVLEHLDPQPGDFMVDGTVDGGGHAAAIMKKIMPAGRFLGVDWDKTNDATRNAERDGRKESDARERYVHGNYADLPAILAKEKLGKADGLLLDLGFSSEQLASVGQGIQFRRSVGERATAHDIRRFAGTGGAALARTERERTRGHHFQIWRRAALAEDRESDRRSARRKHRIVTSGELAEVMRGAVPKEYEAGRIDPATRTFQALRIYANDELGNLKKVMGELREIVKPGGRIAIITFHSLEDRIVKESFQTLAKEEKIEILTKKAVAATAEEEKENPRSRSAKLRAAAVR